MLKTKSSSHTDTNTSTKADTCSPYSSDKEWQEYGQQVYCRNFEQIIEAL